MPLYDIEMTLVTDVYDVYEYKISITSRSGVFNASVRLSVDI